MKPSPGPGERSGSPRHLVVKLAPGWRLSARMRFTGPEPEDSFRPTAELPRGSRVVAMVPELAEADPAKLSPDERNLARYVHVVLPSRRKPAAYLERVRAWPGVEEARLPPEVSLP